MSERNTVALVSGRRAILTGCLAVLLLVFNYGSLVETAFDAAAAAAVFLVLGYLTLTVGDLLFERLLWSG
ncbi:hypothetical protein [Haloterrigena alkaliphila]|uniref:Uncharacterized protein n=1 Tax=Haloterrigena alkaliphila TaxID=2816475 RepID=A0A8A2VDB2_9EURY|nr:hypothetical protein [Haloterrigena alkaliphila]QSW99501.1 hypothetical protein J0X25_00660 [Haloterrigena alkaliphila]